MNKLTLIAIAALIIGGGYYLMGKSADTPQDEHAYDLAAARAQIADVKMDVNTAFLSDEEREVVNLLIEAADLMSEIYMRQVSENNPAIREQIVNSGRADTTLLLDMFDLHFGPWDTLAEGHAFFGDTPHSDGAGFYPADMTKAEFAAWVAAHPEDEEAFQSLFTVIRRDGDRLVAIPYSTHYKQWLEPAAALLRKAAATTSNASLKTFLNLRADAFFSDDYFASDMAWMDLADTPIEVVIGPYEVYTDKMFGYKAAFEAFITLRDPELSDAVARYKAFLRDMEANLPVDESYKNFKRGFESPIAVTGQVHGGGDNVPGVQTIAFNLPNDERVREAKGAKKVLLSNVLGAKFKLILNPMSQHVLVPEQAKLLMRKYMEMGTLFHELAHSLGPGSIMKDGKATTVALELKELYSGIEEGKADVMGTYNQLYLMQRGEMPVAEKENLLATYFVGLFRSMRFGIDEAHGRGAAFQYSYFKEKGAFTHDPETGLYQLNFPVLEAAVTELVHDLVVLQGNGDYDTAAAFLEAYAKTDAAVEGVNTRLADVPVDIKPIYPSRI